MPELERRAMAAEFRFDPQDTGKKKVRGHFAVFHTETDLGWFRERIMPGAFAETIGADDIRALFNHDDSIVLGRNKAGTLSLREDERGLYGEIDLPDSAWGENLRVAMERGDVSQASIGFNVLDSKEEQRDGKWIRVLTRVKLWDVSPVTFPAYDSTDVGFRSYRSAKDVFEAFRRGPENPQQAPEQQLEHLRRQLDLARIA